MGIVSNNNNSPTTIPFTIKYITASNNIIPDTTIRHTREAPMARIQASRPAIDRTPSRSLRLHIEDPAYWLHEIKIKHSQIERDRDLYIAVRTAPARTLNRPTVPPPPIPSYPTAQRTVKSRGYSADPLDRGRYAYSGPFKRPQPLYRKRRDGRMGYFQETDFGGAPVDYGMGFHRPVYPPYMDQGAPTMRRIRPYYAPSYTTYPPSTMHRPKRKHHPDKYPIIFRAVLKVAQLIIGAAVLGLVLSPMRGSSFHDFVVRTKTEWQGAVVGITASFSILTIAFLVTSFCLAHKAAAWRRFDALASIAAAFGYLVAGFIEAYFAACYPPNGAKIGYVCHRPEWIIATILLFINVVAYVIDFWLAWAAGVTLL
ncbi:unnamed protein product, partial [Mesorhabditis spiculigera]